MKDYEVPVGSDLKYVFSSDGAFSFDQHDWDIAFYVGGKSVLMTKRNLQGGGYAKTCSATNMGFMPSGDGDGRWIFLLDTSFFGKGRLYAKLTGYVPDADFSSLDLTRAEVRVCNLISIV